MVLSINGKQSVKLEEIFKFENYFKQISVPFKIYADFECNLKKLNVMKVLIQKNIKTIFLVVLLIKLFVLMINLLNQLLYIHVKIAAYEFIKAILEEYEYCKKIMKKHFNKNFIMTEEDLFQKSKLLDL